MNLMHNFEAFFMLELNDFKFKGQTKKQKKKLTNIYQMEKSLTK